MDDGSKEEVTPITVSCLGCPRLGMYNGDDLPCQGCERHYRRGAMTLRLGSVSSLQ